MLKKSHATVVPFVGLQSRFAIIFRYSDHLMAQRLNLRHACGSEQIDPLNELCRFSPRPADHVKIESQSSSNWDYGSRRADWVAGKRPLNQGTSLRHFTPSPDSMFPSKIHASSTSIRPTISSRRRSGHWYANQPNASLHNEEQVISDINRYGFFSPICTVQSNEH